MPETGRSEAYFIAGMMLLTVILCVAAVFIFIKTYKKEMREKEERAAQKQTKDAPENIGQE